MCGVGIEVVGDTVLMHRGHNQTVYPDANGCVPTLPPRRCRHPLAILSASGLWRERADDGTPSLAAGFLRTGPSVFSLSASLSASPSSRRRISMYPSGDKVMGATT